MPAIAKRNDATGAANFVEYWVKVFNIASHTGDTKRLDSLTDPTCSGCESYVRLYQDTYKKGGYFIGSDWKLSAMRVEAGDDASLVYAHVSATKGEFRRSRSAPIQHGNDENADLAFRVRWTTQGWRVSQLGLQSEIKR